MVARKRPRITRRKKGNKGKTRRKLTGGADYLDRRQQEQQAVDAAALQRQQVDDSGALQRAVADLTEVVKMKRELAEELEKKNEALKEENKALKDRAAELQARIMDFMAVIKIKDSEIVEKDSRIVELEKVCQGWAHMVTAEVSPAKKKPKSQGAAKK